ncbi:MAG: hypothetical protein A3K19_02625 [Lentisphaerae bacterium RIFOXYB12_FULL_65_16]|nr:MAG: hypothetical protein A3K18_10065 [Lentisphaerae bacterium RIFOXYA12_64_32]OGV92245.1 MAG: hypothetical protein A3K19_02625 [Lentisphaerae bacterium RIFOXYB12_FULL_65_16]
MRAKRIALAGLLVSFMLAGCLMVPGRRGREVVVVPALPPVVVLETEPYYVQEGYHYHYQNNGWYYARSRSGPWAPLPRDRYPKDVKFKGGGGGKDGRQNPGHQGR